VIRDAGFRSPEILTARFAIRRINFEKIMHPYDPRTWHWDLLAAFGFVAQALFAARFLVQWIASERRRASHIPVAFWYLSVTGGVLMTIYGVFRRDPVIVLGQAPALIVYIRNLMLIRSSRTIDDAFTK
jgi:lipid-A-disaccharide synthase-like uncharacterized protein